MTLKSKQFVLSVAVTVLLSIPAAVCAQTELGAGGVSPDMLVNPNAIRVLLSPEVETTLAAQMTGTLTSLNATLGGSVNRGDVLAAFDCKEQTARLRMAQAEQTAARETLTTKKQLRKLDAAGDLEVLQASAAAEKAAAAVSLAQAQVSQCTVTAPFTGRVAKVHAKAHQGMQVSAPLIDLVGSGPLKLRLNVPSRMLMHLQEGTPFEVDIDETGKTYPARVTAVNARVDAAAQTVELEAGLDNPAKELLPGMTGVARFSTAP
ncbi:efflux RND transporter periplasmic adaptor subunit [Desulfobulbus oligotrophicus]|uniref:Efflux RND transporter periplasmic adaptor subunit n=1 Tax=Desulfobulbus oligotrophicus TaxID=1909699 RepID=A0A7T5VDF9_9BACT|nr:efflux RND transporter periplasmic adaptor subunit [Desulfobulbus oligotrophicus]QQG65848.1 efflux RND transporter periplasmic adaptor subunit [Desulfobulbus oligotrophicus]